MEAFCIDLDVARPRVAYLDAETLEEDFQAFKTRDPLELADFDRKMFLNEEDADAYLLKYNTVIANLSHFCAREASAPCLLYKRRYLVQTILGEKLQTTRHYKKNWTKGQLINLHDQVFFLTVRLERIVPLEGGYYRYEFKLP